MSSPSPKKKLRIFLSHAPDDKPKVRTLCQRLKEDGFDPWLDDEQVLPGQSREYEIEKALRASDVILLCFSMNSVSKEGYIQREYKRAMDIQMEKPEGTIFVIPVRLDKCEMPHFISKLQGVEYPANYERLLQSLRTRSAISRSPKDMKSKNQKKEQNGIKVSLPIESETVPIVGDSAYPQDIAGGFLRFFNSLRSNMFQKEKRSVNANLPADRATALRIGDFSYRQEVLDRFFRFIRNRESFYMIGAASMGKTRLLDFLMRSQVQRHYLGDNADEYWLVRVDVNRLAIKDESWAFYELLLSSILSALSNHANIDILSAEIAKLDAEIIQHRDGVLALRFFEMAVNKLCQLYDIKLCFLFDEFDKMYRNLPEEIFLQQRAERDANMHRVLFVLFLRDLPENLRPSLDNKGFYELLSRNWIGLGPYTKQDALQIIQKLEERRKFTLTFEQRERLFEASGGHPGIIQALLSTLIDTPNSSQKFDSPSWMKWISRHPIVIEECRMIFDSLSDQEKEGVTAFERGEFDKISPPIEKALFAKGLLQNDDGQARFFSGIFKQYIKSLR